MFNHIHYSVGICNIHTNITITEMSLNFIHLFRFVSVGKVILIIVTSLNLLHEIHTPSFFNSVIANPLESKKCVMLLTSNLGDAIVYHLYIANIRRQVTTENCLTENMNYILADLGTSISRHMCFQPLRQL